MDRKVVRHIVGESNYGYTTWPATRVGNQVIFRGGFARTLTLRERFRLWRNSEATIRP